MSGIIQCPSCKENIDDDSRYCDQCGEQIFVCSSCGRPGKGKRCIFDGKEMVAAGTPPAASSTQASVQAPAQPQQSSTPATSTPAATPSTPATPTIPTASAPPLGDKIKLTSQSLGIVIEASNGDILGRTKGPFAGILGRFSHISGTHCGVVKTSAGWSIEDLGSTNGTFYNNSRLAPNVPAPVQSGSSVKLADVDLLIIYEDAGGGTQRI